LQLIARDSFADSHFGTGWYDDTLRRTLGGWRITRQVCRITWWTGNPFVNETIPGVKFQLATTVVRHEADAGRVEVLTALDGL
jgi:hypothetical protein